MSNPCPARGWKTAKSVTDRLTYLQQNYIIVTERPRAPARASGWCICTTQTVAASKPSITQTVRKSSSERLRQQGRNRFFHTIPPPWLPGVKRSGVGEPLHRIASGALRARQPGLDDRDINYLGGRARPFVAAPAGLWCGLRYTVDRLACDRRWNPQG